ncbi:MAG: hypothetical protein AB7F64_06520 [Gammaproteobacteria bacterium]
MDFSHFYAKLIGYYFIIVALCMFLNPKNMRFFITEMQQNKSLVMFTGAISILFGLIIVLTHNLWFGWPIVITLLGYISVIRGIVRLCFTDWLAQLAPRFTENKPYYVTSSIILIFGVVLLYCGCLTM